MKKMLLLVILLAVPAIVSAQTFIDEDFSGTFPPTGWSADSHPTNWHIGDSENAAGSAPEMVFDWDPQFNGMSRFMSPRIDLTGITELSLQFNHFVDHYAPGYTVGVATRRGTSPWNIVWSRNPSGDVGPDIITVDINNGDVGAADFQIAWYFNGNSYNIDYWYVDNILLYSPMAHDVRVAKILTASQYDAGFALGPMAQVQNFGLNNEVFDVTFNIEMGGNSVYSNTQTGIGLDPGDTITVNFPSYTIPTPNELYEVTVFTVLTGDMNPANDTSETMFNTYTTPRDMVMVEIGTGTWCPYCPGSAMGADDLIENGHNVGVIEYHYANGDPFENEASAARVGYYGITGFPTAVFDGVLKFVGGSSNQSMYSYYLPLFEERAGIKSAFTIEVFGDHSGNSYTLDVRVTKHARIPYENMVLQVALTESDIAFNWQGMNHLEFVERLMVPNADGTPIDFTSGDVQVIPLSFTFNSQWDVNFSEITAFIQNENGKEILQGTKIMLPELVPMGTGDDRVELPLETELVGNYPNPFNPSTTISFSLAKEGNVTLEVFNVLGQRVETLVNSSMPAGNHSIVWDGGSMASGAYFYKLTTDDHSSTRKMVLAK